MCVQQKNRSNGGIETNQSLELSQILADLQESLDGPINEEKSQAHTREQAELTQKFNTQLVESIDQTLTSLGVPVRNTFFQQLQYDFNMPKNAIPDNFDLFIRLLHNAFGVSATRLEVNIIKNLQHELKVDVGLVEYEYPLSKWVVSDFNFKHLVWKAKKLAAEKELNQ